MNTVLPLLFVLVLCGPVLPQDRPPHMLADQSLVEATEAGLKERLSAVLERLNAQMVRVAGGTFSMGCTPEQEGCAEDEKPVRQVQVGSFEISKYEITQELWEAVMGENPSAFGNCPRCPVETVSWDDVQTFVQKLNAAGGRYRLPSEAEWEYAARGGQQSRGYPYSGSNRWAAVAWYYENSNNTTQPVGQKQANELGVYDMSGNVREWVQDCWHESYADAPSDGRAWEQGDCRRRVLRGGSWYGKPGYVRSANRFWYATYFRNNNLGFCLVRPLLARDLVEHHRPHQNLPPCLPFPLLLLSPALHALNLRLCVDFVGLFRHAAPTRKNPRKKWVAIGAVSSFVRREDEPGGEYDPKVFAGYFVGRGVRNPPHRPSPRSMIFLTSLMIG